MNALRIRKTTYSAMYLALALVLPFVTGQIPEIGSMLCPMHFPALLCGFMCGWPWGMAVGFIAPLLRSVLFGMPTLFPTAVAMAFELAVYGGAAGFLRRRLPKNAGTLYAVLLSAMLLGRIAWGLVQWLLSGLSGSAFTWPLFLSGAILNAVPGILLQLVLIPVIVVTMEKAGLSLNRSAEK